LFTRPLILIVPFSAKPQKETLAPILIKELAASASKAPTSEIAIIAFPDLKILTLFAAFKEAIEREEKKKQEFQFYIRLHQEYKKSLGKSPE